MPEGYKTSYWQQEVEVSIPPKPKGMGNLEIMKPSYSDLRFLEKIKKKEKKNYEKEQIIVADEFDINLNQTNKKTINKVNIEKGTTYQYNFMGNKHRIENMLGRQVREGFLKYFFDPVNAAEELLKKVNEVNNYEDKLM